MKELLERMFQHWRAYRAMPGSPCTEQELHAFERRENVRLTEDLRRFFLAANGMNLGLEFGKDDDGFAFWPIEDLVRADIEFRQRSPRSFLPTDGADFYIIGDYLDRSWYYAVKLRGVDAGVVVLFDGLDVYPMAPSFREFLERYLTDRKLLFPPAGRDLTARTSPSASS